MLQPSSVLHPFNLEVTFKVGNTTHTTTFQLDSPAYYSEYYQQVMRGFSRELQSFLPKALQPLAPDPPPQPPAPPEAQENTT